MPNPIPRCQVMPLPNHQVAFLIDGREHLSWHYGTNYPRPYFYPLLGPSGVSLTRMGHPGAPDHDHHQSIWFAHNKVVGIDFWANGKPPTIRQKEWLAYIDGDAEAVMAVKLLWNDGHDATDLLEQELVVSVRPAALDDSPAKQETLLEIQSTFRPASDILEFGKTNFGFLAVRVAKSISARFGGGALTDSEGRVGEPAIFAQRARWMDYSGPVTNDVTEGITYFDHPSNPTHPTHWHVRDDGWMGASACLANPLTIAKDKPLVLRYLLHAHHGPANATSAGAVFQQFANLPPFVVAKSTAKNEAWSVRRVN